MVWIARFKATVRNWHESPLPPCRALARLILCCRRGQVWLTDANHRSQLWTEWRRPERLHQRSNQTTLDRYPPIFSAAASLLGPNWPLRILSFGCSTGEEVVTLARYFPRAWVLGVDLNLRNIKVARRRFPNPQWEFHLSTDANIESRAPFDAVFCLSVLQKTGMRKLQPGENGSDIYPFAKYERQISQLDRWLVPGGLLVIHNSNYRFCDCDMAFNYEVLPKPPGLLLHGMQFDQEGNRLGEIPYEGVFFRKLNPNFD